MCEGPCYIRMCTCGRIIEQCACTHGKPKRISIHTGARGCNECIKKFYEVYPKVSKCKLCGEVDPSSDDCYESEDGYHVF